MFSYFYQLDFHNKLVLHQQIYDETSAKFELKIGPPFIQ